MPVYEIMTTVTGYTYKPYKDHWVIYTPDGLFYCSCDSYREVREELEQIERGENENDI